MSTEEMNIQELESQFNEQERLRREKLVQLQEAGKDPLTYIRLIELIVHNRLRITLKN